MTAVEVEEISRSFATSDGPVTALDGVSFTVDTASIVAVLGANGAGKTTLMKILSSLLLPSAGTARIFGTDVVKDPAATRAVTSVLLGGDRGLYTRLTGLANLRFFGMLAGLSRRQLAERMPVVLKEVGLAEAAGRRVETYSKGMRQRLHVAIGVISRPRLLLLDEPTVGLDPVEAQRLRDSILGMRNGGTTVILTSHYLLDVELLADRVVFLDRGRVGYDGSLARFAAQAGYAAVVDVHAGGAVPDLERLSSGGVVVKQVVHDDGTGTWRATFYLRAWGAEALHQLGELLATTEVVDMQVRSARLEEAYVRMSTLPTE